MALEMQKIVLEDGARLKRQKTGRASRSDPNQGILKNIIYCILILLFIFIGERYNIMTSMIISPIFPFAQSF